ncbi:FKBP-type peptidyl-prolyl cis-trans isomerase FkpA [Veronia nyctiphanis]|uniref:Peptidyl-prolyl cis-trans isomerase n=1 Tax=Veronia nyctiphanis TaxID=1278244 RepID=A0A4Q0YQT8_9GAMM|nr:FKBP-type peptidyl-prolyl cis-trans isomerase [Veronia nyctiphanis]RXJ73426.1 FKBP-type peptidyl-prolyl cis-trans isomerase FkpA [Veronia nyctiphanis]
MKSVLKVSLLAAAVAVAAGCQQEEAKKPETAKAEAVATQEAPAVAFKTEDEKAAYAIGTSLAQYLKSNLEQQSQFGIELNSDVVIQGVQDVFKGEAKLTDEEAQEALKALDARVAAKMKEKTEQESAAAVQAGKDYRDEFAKKDGVKVTDSGLMYQVETLGTGSKPKAEDTVVVHYKGTLINGTKFDSSYDREQPATFPLNRVIPGWTEGVQLMPVGSKFKFVIPPELAYGEQNTPSIPGNSTLVFEVELLEIQGQAPDVPKEEKAEG